MGSLFELVNTTQTESGRATLAAWLLAPAAPEEIRGRQEAVDELRPKVDLRERLGLIAAEAQAWIRTEALIGWARQPRLLESNLARVAAFCLPLASLTLYLSGQWVWSLATLAGQFALGLSWRRPVHQVVRNAGFAQGDLEWLAEVLRCLENEPFQSERLRRMEAEGRCEGISASQAIQRLGKLYSWMDSGNNLVFVIVCKFLLWETQFAFAIEAWRARFGPKVEAWLRRLAEIEALSSLACYAFDHPADPFPELLPATAPRVRVRGSGRFRPSPSSRSSVRAQRHRAGTRAPAHRHQRLEHVRQEHLAAGHRRESRPRFGRRAGARAEVPDDPGADRRFHSHHRFPPGRHFPVLCRDQAAGGDRQARR